MKKINKTQKTLSTKEYKNHVEADASVCPNATKKCNIGVGADASVCPNVTKKYNIGVGADASVCPNSTKAYPNNRRGTGHRAQPTKTYPMHVGVSLDQPAAITLIALVITIIILIILAGVSLNLALGENGIFSKSKTSVDKYEEQNVAEQLKLAVTENDLDNAKEDSKTYYYDFLQKEGYIGEDVQENMAEVNTKKTVGQNTKRKYYLDKDGKLYVEIPNSTQLKLIEQIWNNSISQENEEENKEDTTEYISDTGRWVLDEKNAIVGYTGNLTQLTSEPGCSADTIVIPTKVKNTEGQTVNVTAIGGRGPIFYSSNAPQVSTQLGSSEQKYNLKISYGITNFAENAGAFSGGSFIKSLTIPSTVNCNIQNGTFAGCTNLQEVNIYGGNIKSSGFQGCASIVTLNISDNVTQIEDNTFNTSGIVDLTMPYMSNIKTIFNWQQITKTLKKLKLIGGSDIKDTEMGVFTNLTLLEDLTVGVNMDTTATFSGCTNLTNVKILDNVKVIGQNSFMNCEKINNLSIGKNVNKIGQQAFQNCKSLEKVVMPNTVTEIGNMAFNNCTKLKEIQLKEGLLTIGSQAFQNCELLDTITIPQSVTVIDNYAFKGCVKIPEVNIQNVEMIEHYAFYGCSALKKVTIGSGVKTISYRVFEGCTSLTDVNLTEGLLEIGDNAFCSCTSLKTIRIPSTVNKIWSFAFQNTDSLTDIYIDKEEGSIEVESAGVGKEIWGANKENVTVHWKESE